MAGHLTDRPEHGEGIVDFIATMHARHGKEAMWFVLGMSAARDLIDNGPTLGNLLFAVGTAVGFCMNHEPLREDGPEN